MILRHREGCGAGRLRSRIVSELLLPCCFPPHPSLGTVTLLRTTEWPNWFLNWMLMETRSHLTNISSTSALGCILKHPELVPTERKSVKYYDNQVWVYLHHISLQRRFVFNATQFQNQQKGVGLFLFKHYIHNFIFFNLKFQNKEECLKNIQTKKKRSD